MRKTCNHSEPYPHWHSEHKVYTWRFGIWQISISGYLLILWKATNRLTDNACLKLFLIMVRYYFHCIFLLYHYHFILVDGQNYLLTVRLYLLTVKCKVYTIFLSPFIIISEQYNICCTRYTNLEPHLSFPNTFWSCRITDI